ncbi:MAG: hypothetical protein Q9195_000553 [Heterodermia aff. obscurata]
MSFGSSIGDLVLLTQLAWKTVQNCRRACGEYAALTHETTTLHTLLQRLESEVQSPDGLINRDTDDVQKELSNIIQGCEKNLRVLDLVLEKYNALSETQRSGRKLWQRIRFGNGQIADMTDIRGRNTFCISAISLFLNMLSMGSAGRVEREMTQAGGELRDIRLAVNGITAYLMSGGPEGSVLTAYANDEKAVWKEFRRELVADGFTSSTIRKHKQVIMAYVKELGSRGLLDEIDHNESAERENETSQGMSSRETVEPQVDEWSTNRPASSLQENGSQGLLDKIDHNESGERESVTSHGISNQETVEPMVDERSPNEPPSSLQDITSVEDTNPEVHNTRIQVEPRPGSDVATSDPLEPTPSLIPEPISKDSTSNNSGQAPTTTTSPTALAKLQAIELKLHTTFIPRCEAIIRRPPADRTEWSLAKPKQLVEEILQQIIFELDAVNVEGDVELRALRRDLVWQAEVWLVEVDAISEPPEFSVSEDDHEADDIWPPSAGPSANNGSRFRHDATPPTMFDDHAGPEFEEIELGITGKYAAWLRFAEWYIAEVHADAR